MLPEELPMPLTIADVASTLQTVLTAEADAAARATGFIRRQRQLTGASFVQSLVFGWLANPRATLEGLAAATATVGTPVSPQALDQRFTAPAAECLRVVLQKATAQTLAAQPQAVALLRRFAGVYLLDSTTVSLPAALAELWPGCGGRTAASGRAALKVQLLWDILHGRLHGLDLHAGRAVDVEAPLNAAALPAGALRLADLGYFNLDVLRAYQRRGVYWLTRLKWGTALYVGGRRLRHRVGWLKRQAQAPG